MRRFALLLGLCLLASACSGNSSGVEMSGQAFVPQTFRIAAGETVTFENKSEESHTVTATEDEFPEDAEYFASGGFKTEEEARTDVAGGLIEPGESYEVTLDVPGTYLYLCLPHESSGMTGRIIVER